MTYKQFIDETVEQISLLYDSAEGRALAARLLQHFCGVSSYEHIVEPYGAVAEECLPLLQNAAQQLAVARPIQYIIGYQEFLGRRFSVEEGVLIPRPETEELVRWVIEKVGKRCAVDDKTKENKCNSINDKESVINNNSREYTINGSCVEKLRIIDAACGSGSIAVSLAASLPQSQIYALDISEKALEVTRRNSEALLPDPSQVKIFRYDLLAEEDSLKYKSSALRNDFGDGEVSCGDDSALKVDVIVSNPPYVTNSEKGAMQKNVVDYEPEEALFVPDEEPLIFYKALERFASQWLKPGGAIFLEINERFGSETSAIFKEAGYTNIEIRQDIFGRERMICAHRAY